MSEINLSKAVRSNLLSLQNTANLMAKTQGRLATGLKVNSALDNPTNFFTASSLNSRAGDINQLLDSMANGIQTLEAADNGLKAITKTLESMQSTLRQARQDKSFKTESFTLDVSDTSTVQNLIVSGGAIGDTPVNIALNTVDNITTPGSATTHVAAAAYSAPADGTTFTVNDTTVTLGTAENNIAAAVAKVNADLGAAHDVEAYDASGSLGLRNKADGNTAITVAGAGADTVFGASPTVTPGVDQVGEAGEVKSVDKLVSDINKDFAGQLRASNDNGKLRIENLSTGNLTVSGLTDGEITGGSGSSVIEGNAVRADLANQYNELRDQLDKLADDASFNGINLLRGDNLKITFNETGTSELDIRSKDEQGINAGVLDLISNLDPSQLDDDGDIDTLLDSVKSAINDVRSQASAFGSSLSIVQNRQDFSKNMINTLQTGASNLTLADTNEEAANLLALQTRQQLSSTALSMASQADQAVLRLF